MPRHRKACHSDFVANNYKRNLSYTSATAKITKIYSGNHIGNSPHQTSYRPKTVEMPCSLYRLPSKPTLLFLSCWKRMVQIYFTPEENYFKSWNLSGLFVNNLEFSIREFFFWYNSLIFLQSWNWPEIHFQSEFKSWSSYWTGIKKEMFLIQNILRTIFYKFWRQSYKGSTFTDQRGGITYLVQNSENDVKAPPQPPLNSPDIIMREEWLLTHNFGCD